VLKKHEILLIADEVICGFGRTGKMFGMETYNFSPDIASFAKGITSGYIPLGGVGLTDEVFDVLAAPDRMFMHGFTYSGHPVACATALRNLRIIEEENLPANAAASGAFLLEELNRLLGDHPNVGNIRGRGLMTYVEVVADRGTKAKFDPSQNIGGKLNGATRRRGLIVRGSNDGIAIAPPLIITRDQTAELAGIVAESIHEVG
jgi:4-aminobutyrate---pyruvate transaminase